MAHGGGDGGRHLDGDDAGDAPGAVISPLLANIFLHYAFDWWAKHWRTTVARVEVYLVRYADDFVVCFERKEGGERFLADLRERLRSFGLGLHPDKTRLIEFGRFAASNRRRRGEGQPETFNFLGLHIPTAGSGFLHGGAL